MCYRYGDIPIFITENGFDAKGESGMMGEAALNDQTRVDYLQVGKCNKLHSHVRIFGALIWCPTILPNK